ncbi:MAG: HIT family protein [Bacteroidales bacterium]|jgi:histidine triad (HIT) family protein|nr:HIT family protein [Bacteroidales bacterium]
METIFTKIIKGEIPCYKIAEDENCLAFLDISPIAKGHTLVVPKIQADYIFDLDDDILSALFCFAKKVAKAIKTNVNCTRIGMAVIGLDVPHAHVHLVPISGSSDLDFTKERLNFSPEEFATLANIFNRTFKL